MVAARDSIPQPKVRVTTASSRGNLMRRGRGRSTTPRQSATLNPGTEQGSTSRGRKKASKTTNFRAPTQTARIEPATFIPDLNSAFSLQDDAQEVPLSQNAPATTDDM